MAEMRPAIRFSPRVLCIWGPAPFCAILHMEDVAGLAERHAFSATSWTFCVEPTAQELVPLSAEPRSARLLLLPVERKVKMWLLAQASLQASQTPSGRWSHTTP